MTQWPGPAVDPNEPSLFLGQRAPPAPDPAAGGPPGPPPLGRHHHHVHTRTIAGGAVVLLAMGAVIGTFLAPAPNAPSSSTPTTVARGSSTESPGAPANSAALAAAAAPALVDIDVTDAYQAVAGAGTGMVLTSSGVVLTNNHVVEGETSVSVRDVGNGRTYGATVLGYDRSQDVAVLQLAGASGLRTIAMGDSGLAAVGDGVVAVGNARGTGGTPSRAGGAITALDQSIYAQDEVTGATEQLTGLFETNASIVPGYSGGALVNTSSRVIGMVTAASEGFEFGSSATQGYAIPIATARRIAAEIVAKERSDTVHVGATPFLGVQVTAAGSEGALIATVVSGGPADRAGLTSGDTITAVDTVPVTSPESLTDALLRFSPGATVRILSVDPSGRQSSVDVTLARGPPQ